MLLTLLEETIDVLSKHGKKPEDVHYIGNIQHTLACTWEQFEKLANIQYDKYGLEEIATDLIIVGNQWWMERSSSDGPAEWWTFHTHPCIDMTIKPKEIKRLHRVHKDEYEHSLEEMYENDILYEFLDEYLCQIYGLISPHYREVTPDDNIFYTLMHSFKKMIVKYQITPDYITAYLKKYPFIIERINTLKSNTGSNYLSPLIFYCMGLDIDMAKDCWPYHKPFTIEEYMTPLGIVSNKL